MMKNKIGLQETKHKIFFIIFFVFSTALLHFRSYDKLPTGIHVLQQSDHFAVALGFLDNGFDFFHPTSFALNPEFPSKNKLINPQGVTAIDFPVMHYSAALMMKVFNTKSPIIFRLLSLLWSFIALFMFFTAIEKLKGFWVAIFFCGFIMFQPIYCFYENGFHVSAMAFNSFLIGFVFFIRYYFNNNQLLFVWGVFFLTLAALMRFTQIIVLLALLSMYLFQMFKSRKINKNMFFVLCGVGLVLLYFGYNQYLRENYGTLFLSEPRVASSFEELMKHLLKIAKKYWRNFFTFFHLASLLVILYLYLKQDRKPNQILQKLKVWAIFTFIGVIIFTFLMSFDVSFHDYYSLDTWLPLLMMIMIYLIFSIDTGRFSTRQISVFVIIFLVGSFFIAFEKQRSKYNGNRKLIEDDLVLVDFQKSKTFLDNNIAEKDKILIISGWGWNTPMIGWNRKAFIVANDFKEKIPFELKNDYDIIVTHNASFEQIVLNNFGEFYSKVEYLNSNGKVSLWVLKNEIENSN